MGQFSEVDLHLHSTASDGTLSPQELVALALERGLRYIALTDHDSTEGIDAALAAAEGTGLSVIPGVELNTDVPAGEAHVLGYYLDHHDRELQRLLTGRRQARLARGLEMVRKLQGLGLEISWERVQELAGAAGGGAVGRPHVAQALLERGYVQSIQEAFDRYIGRGGPAYVPYEKFEPEEAVRVIRRAGGVPVLAHPTSFPDYQTMLPRLLAVGLAGLECYYGTYTAAEVQALLELAERYGLVATGGSDFHGQETGFSTTLGGTFVPISVIERLRECVMRNA
jgi:predicted metal-dependent phosphoesterase TrpH